MLIKHKYQPKVLEEKNHPIEFEFLTSYAIATSSSLPSFALTNQTNYKLVYIITLAITWTKIKTSV